MIILYEEYDQVLQAHNVVLVKDDLEKKRIYTIENIEKLGLTKTIFRINEALDHLQKDTYPE